MRSAALRMETLSVSNIGALTIENDKCRAILAGILIWKTGPLAVLV